MYKLLSLLFLSLIIVLSCEKSNPKTEPDVDILVPLAVGNQWEYIDSLYDQNGDLFNIIERKRKVIDMSEYAFEGESLDLYHINYYSFSDYKGWEDYSWLYNYDEDGYNCYGGVRADGQLDVLAKCTTAKFPVELNEGWDKAEISVSSQADPPFFLNGNTRHYTCESIDTIINTQVGNFSCYKFSYTKSSGLDVTKTSIYYSVNIGCVAMTIIKNDTLLTFKRLLTGYTLVE